MQVHKLSEVFKTVGLPPYTYVKPKHFGEVRSDLEQPGKHVLIEGPSGIGKSCIVFKIFEELGWVDGTDYRYTSGRDENVKSVISEFISAAKDLAAKPNVLIVDDFHILDEAFRIQIGSELKRISDTAFKGGEPAKVILIGIPTAGTSLLAGASDLGPRLGSYRFGRAEDAEISKLMAEGERALNILFEDPDVILAESAGNFWLAQYVCNKVCAINEIHGTCADVAIVGYDLLNIRKRLMEELSNRFMSTAIVFAKGKKWRPGGNKPYLEVLLSLAKIPDLVVPFDAILQLAPERRRPGIKAVKPRIREIIHNPTKGIDLRKQIAFEDSGFSLEDPLFRYFLSNMSPASLFRELGIAETAIDQSSIYTYDIGFSFAGQARPMVELVNTELKQEDVVTFYDFDKQAFLLAENLEEVLGRIYSESCRYYLVFLERNYLEKVWTRYEKDVMTKSPRSRHIVPVYLDAPSDISVVGIPSTIGMIDLSDLWRQLQNNPQDSSAIVSALRNRLVLPILEKIDNTTETI
jgi:hypothetical protein